MRNTKWFLLLPILFLLSSFVVFSFSDLESNTVAIADSVIDGDLDEEAIIYMDPLYGQKQLYLDYPSTIKLGEPLSIKLEASGASTKNNFNLRIQGDTSLQPPFDMIISSTGITAQWIFNITENKTLILSNVNGEITQFQIFVETTNIKTSIQTTKPLIVFQNENFIIKSLQESEHIKNLYLEPPCDFIVNRIDSFRTEHIFNCSINQKTFFELYAQENLIDSFVIKTHPLDYCNPFCDENQLCENNICVTKYLLPGESCILSDLPCVTNYVCVNGTCKQEAVMRSEGESCDDTLHICKEGLICQNICVIEQGNINETEDNVTFENNVTIIHNQTQENTNDEIPVLTNNSDDLTTENNPLEEEVEEIDFLVNKESDEINTQDNDSKYDVQRFEQDLRSKMRVPEKATDVIVKKSVIPLRIEKLEDRNFTVIKESIIEQKSTDLNNKSKEDLTKILHRERVLKTNIEEQQEKANEQVTIQKKIVYEKEEPKSGKTNQEFSTKVVIRIQPKENQTTIKVIEVIPKEVALSAKDLIYSVEPIILEDDPVIMWQLDNVDEPVELSYRVEKNVSVTGNTILLSDDVKPEFDWRTLLPLLFIPLIGGLVIGFSKFEESRKKNHHEELETISNK